MGLVQPAIPGTVHGRRIADIGQDDGGGEQSALIRTRLGQQGINLFQDIRGLAFCIQAGVIGHLAGQPDQPTANHGAGEAFFRGKARDGHGGSGPLRAKRGAGLHYRLWLAVRFSFTGRKASWKILWGLGKGLRQKNKIDTFDANKM